MEAAFFIAAADGIGDKRTIATIDDDRGHSLPRRQFAGARNVINFLAGVHYERRASSGSGNK